MAWRNPTKAELERLGLADVVTQARLTPAPGARRGRRRTAQGLAMLLGTALQEAYPGVFTPLPKLGIAWGCARRKLGIVCGGVVRTEATADWCIVPVWEPDMDTPKKLRAVVTRIGEFLT